jgi:LPS export ABC transporter protein LptC
MLKADTMLFTQEGRNVTINYNDSGRLKAKIFAKQLIGYKKDGNDIVRMPKGVTGNFYNDEGKVESYLSAEKGISYQTQKITEVSQNVVVMNNKGEKLNTEKLIWDQKKQIIYTDKFVRITTKNEILTGEGMESKQDFSDWVIKKPRGVISIQDSTKKDK